MYRLVAETFAGKEFRAVFCPLSTGRQSHRKTQDDPPENQGGLCLGGEMPSLPPADAGGGGGSDSGSAPPLVKALESVKRSHSELAERVFSRAASERVRRIGVAAEQMEPDRRMWIFATVTWPTDSQEGMAAIARDSGWVVQQLKNYWRSRAYAAKEFFYVWERQRRGTLHLHWVQRLSTGVSDHRVNGEFRAAAYRILRKHCTRSGVNLLASRNGDWSGSPEVLRNEAQIVRKSVARYLSKYVSKGCRSQSAHWAAIGAPSPRRWWGASDSLKRKVDELTSTSRIDFTSYRAAANSFAELIDISMLRVLPTQCRRRYLSECSGEVFTIFSEAVLCSLSNLWKNYGKRCGLKPQSQKKMKHMKDYCSQSSSLDDLLLLLQKMQTNRAYPRTARDWASQVLDGLLVTDYSHSGSHSVAQVLRIAVKTGTELQFSKFRCSSRVRMKYELETLLAEILGLLWDLSSVPNKTVTEWIGLRQAATKPVPSAWEQRSLIG